MSQVKFPPGFVARENDAKPHGELENGKAKTGAEEKAAKRKVCVLQIEDGVQVLSLEVLVLS